MFPTQWQLKIIHSKEQLTHIFQYPLQLSIQHSFPHNVERFCSASERDSGGKI